MGEGSANRESGSVGYMRDKMPEEEEEEEALIATASAFHDR